MGFLNFIAGTIIVGLVIVVVANFIYNVWEDIKKFNKY